MTRVDESKIDNDLNESKQMCINEPVWTSQEECHFSKPQIKVKTLPLENRNRIK